MRWDNILNNGFGLRGHFHVYLTKICTMLTSITSITKLFFCGGYRCMVEIFHVNLYIYFENIGRLSTMHHVPWTTFMSITNFKMLGGYER